MVICDETAGEDHIFSTNAFCRQCGKRFDPIEPRSFSFNSPYGACPRCTGLGITLEVDPELVIPNPRLTLAEGAIQYGRESSQPRLLSKTFLVEVAKAHNFSLNTSVKDLSKDVMDVLFMALMAKNMKLLAKAQFEGLFR